MTANGSKAKQAQIITTEHGFVCCDDHGRNWCGRVHGDMRAAALCFVKYFNALDGKAQSANTRTVHLGGTMQLDEGDVGAMVLSSDVDPTPGELGIYLDTLNCENDEQLALAIEADLAVCPAPIASRLVYGTGAQRLSERPAAVKAPTARVAKSSVHPRKTTRAPRAA